MSGKLIMKRKLDKNQIQSQQQHFGTEDDAPSSSERRESTQPTPSSNNDDEGSSNESRVSSSISSSREYPQSKRIRRCDTPPPERYDTPPPDRCDTPPPELEDGAHNRPIMAANPIVDNQRNRQLLEAIQSKMLELQRELDEFEEDFDNYDEGDYYNSPPLEQNLISAQEAEALGYAMCAQETIRFLEREGISSDSLLYTRLREALVGRAQNDQVFQI